MTPRWPTTTERRKSYKSPGAGTTSNLSRQLRDALCLQRQPSNFSGFVAAPPAKPNVHPQPLPVFSLPPASSSSSSSQCESLRPVERLATFRDSSTLVHRHDADEKASAKATNEDDIILATHKARRKAAGMRGLHRYVKTQIEKNGFAKLIGHMLPRTKLSRWAREEFGCTCTVTQKRAQREYWCWKCDKWKSSYMKELSPEGTEWDGTCPTCDTFLVDSQIADHIGHKLSRQQTVIVFTPDDNESA